MNSVRTLRRPARRPSIRPLIIEALQPRQLLAADFNLIADFNPEDSLTTGVGNIANVGGVVYFGQSDSTHGMELWRSGGTDATTFLIKDINPGVGHSYPKYFTNVNGTLFFVADTDDGRELWKTDGTTLGTVMVKDINTSGQTYVLNLINAGGVLYFSATDGSHGRELWKSDGTAAGTVMVRDISTGTANSFPSAIVNIGTTIYFTANDGTTGRELWKSDGTSAGTLLVRDTQTGANSGLQYNSNKAIVNGVIFFASNDGTNGQELWRSNGTFAGTFMVADSLPGIDGTYPSELINLGGTLLFKGATAFSGRELWKSNGTAASTTLVKDIYSGSSDSDIASLTVAGSTLFFAATSAGGREVWKSDGTSAGTSVVRDLNSQPQGSMPDQLVNVNGIVYFAANDGVNGYELWKSDGTFAGTTLVKNIKLTGSSLPRQLTNVGDILYFSAASDEHGSELWKSNGTLTSEVTTSHATGNSSPTLAASINNRLLLFADTGSGKEKLWSTDGTVGGTIMCSPASGFDAYEFSSYRAQIGNVLYFVAKDDAHGLELWRSDGTLAGTYLVRDIAAGPASGDVRDLVNLNGILYFSADDGTTGNELWRSDGTNSGTFLVAEIQPGSSGSVQRLFNANGTLLFSTNDGSIGNELWRSDGTLFGTSLVRDIFLGASSSDPVRFTQAGSNFFFTANGPQGVELWRTNGTTAGTVLVKDIHPTDSSFPDDLTNVGGTLFFFARDDLNGTELWKSDGTAAGTSMVKDITPGSASTSVSELINFNGALYFNATDPALGRELWKSDGTAAGTNILKDINPGSGDSVRFSMTVLNGQLYFAANDGVHGEEVWTSDGTSAGTNMRVDLTGDSGGSDPDQFMLIGNQLFTSANSTEHGRELYVQSTDLLVTPVGSGAHNITIRRNGAMLEAVDTATNAVLNSLETVYAQSITFDGIGPGNDTVTIDYAFGGFFALANGMHILDGNLGSDTLTINGNGSTIATYLSSGGAFGQASLLIQQGQTSCTITFSNVENISLANMQSVSTLGSVSIASSSFSIDSALPVNLSNQTSIAGGTLTSTSPLAIGSGEALLGFGTVSGRVSAEASSLISAQGPLTVGNAASVTGFATRGELKVNQFSVALGDANQAVLGELTTLGSGALPGNLAATNGLLVDFGNNVTGYGTLTTTNSANKPFINNGAIIGNSPAQPLTLTGYVKGVGTLDNVNIVGTFSPGFSPAAVTLGTMTYSAGSTTVVEIGGTSPGTGYDQLNHTGQAILGGTLDLQLIGGFVPSVGNSFTIMTATGGFVGGFANVNLPALPTGLQWSLVTSAGAMLANVVAVNVAPSDILLSNSTIVENVATGAQIGTLGTSDANPGDTFSYTLVSGVGSQDNGRFSIDASGTLRSNSAFDFEALSSYSIRVRTTDQGGLFAERTFTISVIDEPELVGDPIFGDGTAQRSMIKQLVITLDGPVTILPGAFSFTKRGAGAVDTNATVVNNPGQTIVTLQFSGAFTRAGGALVDGYYELRIEGGRIVRGAQALDANKDGVGGDTFQRGTVETDNYFALYGDTSGDGIVGVAEFGQFRTAFGKSSPDSAYNVLFDYEGDGIIGVTDFGQFRTRFGKPKPTF